MSEQVTVTIDGAPIEVTIELRGPVGPPGPDTQDALDYFLTDAGAGLVGWKNAGTGATTRSVQSKLRDTVSPKDFGAVGGGIVDDTTALTMAITYAASINAVLDGGGATYRTTSVINVPTAGMLRWNNFTILSDHAGTTIADTGGTVARGTFQSLRLLTTATAAPIAWDCNQWQYCQWTDCFVGGTGGTTGYVRAWKIYNVSYWNTFYSPEVEAAAIAWDLNDANDTRLFMPRHVRFGGTATNSILFSGACSGINVYGCSFENVYASADVINFHVDCEHCYVWGGRVEARSGSSAVLPVKFNGSDSNGIYGVYIQGAGISSLSDIATSPANDFQVFQNGLTTPHMGKGYLVIPYNTASAGEKGAINYNVTSDRFTGFTAGSGARNFTQTPALETLDMNGNPVTNVGGLTLNTAASNPGASKVSLGSTVATTVGAAGGASALPATPLGYLNAFVGATAVKIPYFSA